MASHLTQRMRILALPAGLAVAGLALAGCTAGASTSAPSAAATPNPNVDQSIVFALKEDPKCLDPQQTSLTTALNVGRQLVDSLLDQNPDTGEIVPWLATEWSSNKDLTAYTFTLKDGVTFSDGTPLTAQVVADNFDAIAASAHPPRSRTATSSATPARP